MDDFLIVVFVFDTMNRAFGNGYFIELLFENIDNGFDVFFAASLGK
jgi:hypothetical protein